MALYLNTNVPSLNSQRVLGGSTMALQGSMEKLSSGYRINRSADDAAGLAIAKRLEGDIRSINVAKRNGNDAISLVQTAEGGLNEVSNVLLRLRELATQAASDSVGNQEREFINKEFTALKDEIDRISVSTEYDGSFLLLGKNPAGKIPDARMAKLSNSSPLEFQIGTHWSSALDGLPGAEDEALNDTTEINDQDDPTARFRRNPVNVIRINLDDIDSTTTGLGLGRGNDIGAESTGTYLVSDDATASKKRAQRSIEKLEMAMDKINNNRAYLGSVQNRLGYTLSGLNTADENLSSAKSRIIDTDYASETAKQTQANIRQQAGTAMLAQANSNPNFILSLLRSQ